VSGLGVCPQLVCSEVLQEYLRYPYQPTVASFNYEYTTIGPGHHSRYMTLVLRSAISTREEAKRAVRRVPGLGELSSMDSKTSRAPSERRPRTHWATCHSQNEGWHNRTSKRRSSWVHFPCRNRGFLDSPYNSTVDQPRSANQCVG
jgi:hypothetical protein